MGGQIYISNLPSDTTDVDLFKLFCTFGALAPSGVKAMTNDDGSCKGIGFVDFIDPACADAAIAALNGTTTMSGGYINCTKKIAKKGGKGDGKGKGDKDDGKGKGKQSMIMQQWA